MSESLLTRRQAFGLLAGTIVGPLSASTLPAGDVAAPPGPFQFKYILASALYGKMKIEEIASEVQKTGASAIDIWCLPHGNQREQIDEMGLDAFADLLTSRRITLGVLTRYPLGPFKLADEMKVARRLGCTMLVTGTGGPKDVTGEDAKREIKAFLEKMKPHADAAGELGVTIALENHMASLLATPDSIRYFAEFNRHPQLGVAFAPHHLHTWVDEMPKLIEVLGQHLVFFYAQEHGKGAKAPMPKANELLQLPGFGGGLDYKPLVSSLRRINFRGWTEIFMHPFPRGQPILPTATEITAAVNRSRLYLEDCAKQTA